LFWPHSPGIVGIDCHLADGSIGEPVMTICKSTIATRPMKFSISAATEIEFYGDRHIHSYVSHQFSGYSGSRLELVARARQFSSFILIVGKIISADKFDPKCAIIIKDKDELKIPLDMNTVCVFICLFVCLFVLFILFCFTSEILVTYFKIPTPKEFRDAIESLSPEQQVCIISICVNVCFGCLTYS
jgi:hypothetical protein